MEIRIC